ncbi:MAG: GreA/GreB family elongation factor [Planctomycetota bacterium]|jgi:hypothetical protein|nr:GreA/GreB family elongation factor [Planctomycetota bacterium]
MFDLLRPVKWCYRAIRHAVCKPRRLREIRQKFQTDFLGADAFYEKECAEFITRQEYETEKQTFLWEKRRQELFAELCRKFQSDFLGADVFYQKECTEFITRQEYEKGKEFYRAKHRLELLPILRQKIPTDFLGVDAFYEKECAEFITRQEYETEKEDYRAKHRVELLPILRRKFQTDFRDANAFYKEKCAEFITREEYEIEKMVGLYCTVVFKFKRSKDNVTMKRTLVPENESDIVAGKIHCLTPLGQALIGHKVGDVVEAHLPGGLVELEILKIE